MPSYKDITGQRFGRLTALHPTDKRQGTNIIWCFRCDCGNLVERTTSHIPEDAACSVCRPRGVSIRKDYSGQRFGRLVALNCTGDHRGKELVWRLQCDCGNIIELPVSKFISGNTKSCGCLKAEASRNNAKNFHGPNPNFTDLSGTRYGMLVVLERDSSKPSRRVRWICRCDCGNETTATTSELSDGKKRSCGCTDARLFSVFKHVFPDGRIYVGTTSQKPWRAFFSGSKYTNQESMQEAIDNLGGYDQFKVLAKHYFYTPTGEWFPISSQKPFIETNLFTADAAEELKRHFIEEYRSTDIAFGFNSASGGNEGFTYNATARERQISTKTGANGKSTWSVYYHKSMINNKVYVGTTSRDPIVRWNAGKGYSRLKNSQFWNDIEKYGWDSFEHVVVKTGLTKKEAMAFEQGLIADFDSTNPEKGYNITIGGDGSYGFKQSDETKKKLSELASKRIKDTGVVNFKGQHHSEKTKSVLREKMLGKYYGGKNPFAGKRHDENTKEAISKKNSQPIHQYSLSGDFLQVFPSATIAAESIGRTTTAICDAANGRTRFCGDYIWRYAKDAPPPGESIDAKAILGDSKHTGVKKRVNQLDPNGILLHQFNSLTEAAAAVGSNVSNISAAVNGRVKTCKGFKWSLE